MNNKHDNFKRISEKRLQKIHFLINQLCNLSNTSFYEYSDNDIDNAFDSIESDLKRVRNYLRNKNDKKRRF